MKAEKRRRALTRSALAVGAIVAASSAPAATITVNSTADVIAVNGQCTLREAIDNANNNAATHADCAAGAGADTIVFNVPNPSTITLSGAELPMIVDPMTIAGPGTTALTISGNNLSRIFEIALIGTDAPISVAINNMTLTSGSAVDGGAIKDYGESLTLDHVVISGNTAAVNGGGVAFLQKGDKAFTGTLSITDSSISNNTAGIRGGGLDALGYASMYLKSDTFDSNSNAGANGGGMNVVIASAGAAVGTFQMLNTVVSNNVSGTSANANGSGGGVRLDSLGGAVNATIADSVISGNIADQNDAVGPSADASKGSGGGLFVNVGVTATVRRTTVSGNTAQTGGGVFLYSATGTLENVTISENQAKNPAAAGLGAGLVVQGIAIATVKESTIASNAAQSGGGGLDLGSAGVTLSDVIVANNTGGAAAPDINGAVTANYTVVKTPGTAIIGGAVGNVTGSDPLLGSLAVNGSTITAGAPGLTQPPKTMLPGAGSPAINAGDPAFTAPPATDGRGFPRVVSGRVDMGAVEVAPSISIADVSLNEGNAGTTAFTFTVTLSGASSQAITVNYATSPGTALTIGGTPGNPDFTAASGTLTFPAGVTSRTFDVNVNGDMVSEPNETFTVTLSSPVNATIATGTATGTIVNDDGTPSLAINNVSQAEGNAGTTAFTFTVTLSAATSQNVTVDYATSNGTALTTGGTPGNPDLTAASGTLTLAPGVTSTTFTVNVNGDTVPEPNETFTVGLSSPVNATIATGTGTGTIVNDDGAPSFSIDNVTQAEGNAGTTNMTFTVSLSAASGATTTVDFTTVNGTATGGSDFTAQAATLTFAPGSTTAIIAVPITGDTICEPNETFTVVLSSPVNATVATGTGTGTITNDDACTADLAITKSVGGGTLAPGSNGVYTIVVRNYGPRDATGVTVTDTLPAGTTFQSVTSSSGTCSGTATVTCALGSLANGSSATITLTVRFDAAGTLTNTVIVASDIADGDPTNNSASAAAAVTGGAAATSIPTLDAKALALLAAILAFMGAMVVKR